MTLALRIVMMVIVGWFSFAAGLCTAADDNFGAVIFLVFAFLFGAGLAVILTIDWDTMREQRAKLRRLSAQLAEGPSLSSQQYQARHVRVKHPIYNQDTEVTP